MDDDGEIPSTAAGFIGAAVALILVVIFMILIVILVKQCLALRSKRRAIRDRMDQEVTRTQAARRRRGSVTDAVPANFNWHHSIRVEGTPPPSYGEAEKLPTLDNGTAAIGENVTKKAAFRTGSTVPLISKEKAESDNDMCVFSAQYTQYARNS